MGALLERETVVAALAGLIDTLDTEQRGDVALIEGPAGIGKSSVLAAGLAIARERKLQVLTAHGSELEHQLSFGGARQLLTPPLVALDDSQRATVLAGPAGMAAPVLGFATPEAPPGVGDPLHGMFWTCVALADRRALVVAVDDAHWLDAESGRFIAHLARRLAELPILLLATARPSEPGAVSPVLAELRATAIVLAPQPLSLAAVQALGGDADAHRQTGGNPFLLAELRRSASAGLTGSSNVAQSVLGRAARISEAAVQLVRALALFPDGAQLRDLAAVAELDPDDATNAADALVRAEVLADEDTPRFMHPLMRAAVYDDLGTFARPRGHQRAAAVLRARDADAEQIAAHLLATEPDGRPENVAVLLEVAERAGEFAPRARARYLERALAEPPESAGERATIGLELGRAQAAIGDPAAEQTLRTALRESEQPEQQATLAFEVAAAASENFQYGRALEDLESVAAVEAPREQRLALDAVTAIVGLYVPGGVDAGARALARIPPDLPGDSPAERLALLAQANDAYVRGEPAAEITELLSRVVDSGGPLSPASGAALTATTEMLIGCGALDLVAELATEDSLRAQELGQEAVYADAQHLLGTVAMMRGEFRAAEAFSQLALDLPGIAVRANRWAVRALIQILGFQGRFAEAEALVAELRTEATPGSITESHLAKYRGVLAVLHGDWDAALPALEAVEIRLNEHGFDNPVERMHTQYLAPALVAAGRPDEARRVLETWLELGRRFGAPLPLGTAHTELYRLDPKTGREHLEEAVRIFEASQYGWNRAWVRAELGAALRRDNQAAAGRALLEEALDYAAREGVEPLAAFAEAELRLTGARPRRRELSGAASLTPAEHRIARLAADGRTNREIAQHLFLTVKTVEGHLGRVFRKLDVSSRRELARALAT